FDCDWSSDVCSSDLSLDNGDLTLLGSEMPSEDPEGHTITLMLVCDNKVEFLNKFNKLAEGGKVIHPGEIFFAGTMGNLIDKFGRSEERRVGKECRSQ